MRRKHTRVDGSAGDLFAYDDFDRLVGAKLGVPQSDIDGSYGAAASAVEIAYALDPGQNRSSVTVTLSGQNPQTTPYTTEGDSPRYAGIGGVTPLYDGEGNLAFDGSYYYVYDFKNRLAEVYVAVDGAMQGMTAGASLSGSGTGTLSPSTASRITLQDLRAGREQILQQAGYDLVSYCQQHSIYMGAGALRASGLTASGGATSGGSLVERVESDPYGKARVYAGGTGPALAASTVGNPYLYTGHRRDEETGLVYARNRYLHTGQGRSIMNHMFRTF